MSLPELSRRVDAYEEDLRAVSDTVIEIRDDVAEIKIEYGRLLAEHSATPGQLDAALTLLTRSKTG